MTRTDSFVVISYRLVMWSPTTRLICSVSKVEDETALTHIANFLVDFSKNNLNDISIWYHISATVYSVVCGDAISPH